MTGIIQDPRDRMVYEWAARIEEGKETFLEGPPMSPEYRRKMLLYVEDMVEKFREEAAARFPDKVDEMEAKLMSILEPRRLASRWDAVISAMLDVADVADEAGRYAEADAIASLLPKANLVKSAQYESGQNYWTLNQRAFERAWRIKRQKAGLSQSVPITEDDFRSAQECWLEVLEEYQDALLGQDAEMLSKYAAKDNPSCPKCGHYNAMLEHWDETKGQFYRKCRDCGHEAKKPEDKPEPEVETSAIMSENMTAFHDQMDEQAKSQGVSSGEFIANKFGPKGASMGREILNKVSERLMEGSAPGVAFYEAMDHFTSGKYEREIMADVMNVAKRLAYVMDVEKPDLGSTHEDKVKRLEQLLMTLKQAIPVFEEAFEEVTKRDYPQAAPFGVKEIEPKKEEAFS